MNDVIVLGGGPAGSTFATLLARAGCRVVVLERETFPRFHIGESLLPLSLPILARLGVDTSRSSFHRKEGAEFFDADTGDHAVYPFADALPDGRGPGYAFQVERAAFDHALLENAEACGARVLQGEEAIDLESFDDHVVVTTQRDRYDGRYCVDATGQWALSARRRRTAVPMGDFGRAAAFTHYTNLSDDALAMLGPEGNIKVLMQREGWGWIIPLSAGRVSIGTVLRKLESKEAALDNLVDGSPLFRRVVDGATRGQTRVVGNFSYKNTNPAWSRVSCIGDAACFLDPVFSSGVALAMFGAEALADCVAPALERGSEGDPNLLEPVHRELDRAYAGFGSLIYAFYHTRLIHRLFFAKRQDPELRAGLISMLAGDLWREDNAFAQMLARSRHRWAPPAARSPVKL